MEGDFFFADDDPQMQATEEVAARFPGGQQILVRVEDLAGDSAAYVGRVAGLTTDLLAVDGITGGYSVSNADAVRSPLFRRILLTPDTDATNIVLQADDTDPELLVPRLEEVLAGHEAPELGVVMSGVPVIVELIRRSLARDLVVFSGSAVVVFALIIGLIYRDAAIVAGTLATCGLSVAVTLITTQALGVAIGLLTANLVTIVFVLTLTHVVFLTGNWARSVREGAGADAVARGVRDTLEGSFWSMATTFLGFVSLLLASARPLRELGVAGAIGTVAAMATAYVAYPAFLASWAKPRRSEAGSVRAAPAVDKGRVGVLSAAAVLVVLMAWGALRVNTDPGLLTYFGEGSELRDGLEQMDLDGGSSTLDIVVRGPDGARVDFPAVFAAVEALQDSLEADPAVGMVISPAVLIAHARTLPLAGFLPVPLLLELASGPQGDGVALGYVTPDRLEARYFLRMREAGRTEARDSVTERLRGYVGDVGLEPVAVAGLFDLQAQLGRLIASSLRIGIGGLLLLFLGVALAVARDVGLAARMWVCLAAIPAVVLGTFGHLGIAIDIITSPAANVALAMGADSMIHLVVRVRRLARTGAPEPWTRAVQEIGRPILGATGILSAGFGIFVLSAFPPTQRFGLAVVLGSLTAAAVSLLVLPRLASRPRSAVAE